MFENIINGISNLFASVVESFERGTMGDEMYEILHDDKYDMTDVVENEEAMAAVVGSFETEEKTLEETLADLDAESDQAGEEAKAAVIANGGTVWEGNMAAHWTKIRVIARWTVLQQESLLDMITVSFAIGFGMLGRWQGWIKDEGEQS